MFYSTKTMEKVPTREELENMYDDLLERKQIFFDTVCELQSVEYSEERKTAIVQLQLRLFVDEEPLENFHTFTAQDIYNMKKEKDFGGEFASRKIFFISENPKAEAVFMCYAADDKKCYGLERNIIDMGQHYVIVNASISKEELLASGNWKLEKSFCERYANYVPTYEELDEESVIQKYIDDSAVFERDYEADWLKSEKEELEDDEEMEL